MMKKRILLFGLIILLILPFTKALELNISTNITIPYNTSISLNYTCCNASGNSSNCSTNTIIKNLSILVPYYDNELFELNNANNYSINSSNYKVFLKSNDSISDFNVKINGLNNTDLLKISFLTRFEQPELVKVSSLLFNNLSFYVKNNESYTIQTTLKDNQSVYNVSFFLPEFNITINKTIRFKDTLPPNLIVYKLFNQMVVGQKYLLRVFYTDESPITRINYSINGSDLLVNVVKKPSYVDFVITPLEYGTTNFSIKFTDSFNNSVSKNFNFVISPEGNFHINDLNIPRLLVGKTHIFKLYDGEMLNFNITLVNESFVGNKTPVVWVKAGSSQVQLPLNNTQHIIANSLSFMVESNYKGVFDCTLKFDYPKKVSGNHYFHFHTVFANYSLLPEENLTINGVTTTCKLVEAPNFEDSKVVCSVNLPYDAVSEDTLMIVPKRDFEWYQNMMQDRINNWKDKFNNQKFLKNITLIILGIVLFSGFVWIAKPEYFIGGK